MTELLATSGSSQPESRERVSAADRAETGNDGEVHDLVGGLREATPDVCHYAFLVSRIVDIWP